MPELEAAFRELAVALDQFAAAASAFARDFVRPWTRARFEEARRSLVRPDGRPRRTGHRHKGAW